MTVDVTVPVDDTALNLIEEAMRTAYDLNDNGDLVLNGEYTIHQLLEFWSGYDATKEETISEDVTIYRGGTILHEHDIIRALINEIHRLRGNDA